jgi:hypothetical protein
VRKTVLQIGVHRQIGRCGNIATIGNPLTARHCAIGPAEHVGETEAGGCHRLQAQRSKQSRGASIPGIGNDEGAGPLMQRAKCYGFIGLGPHCVVSFL